MTFRTVACLSFAWCVLLGCGTPGLPPSAKPDPYAGYRDLPDHELQGGRVPGRTLVAGAAKVECMEREVVRVYMRRVQRDMYERWELPPDVAAGSRVAIRFTLRADGALDTAEADGAGPPAFADSALAALQAAAPFGAPPQCVVGESLVGHFTNPQAVGAR